MTGPASRDDGAARSQIRIGHVPNPFALPYLVALERGFFADEGLQVDDTRVSNGSVIADALARGELDVGTGGHLQTAAAVAAGSDQAFIAPLGFERAPDHLCIVLVSRRDRARSLGELAGRTVAVSARGAISELQLRIALAGARVRTVAMPFSRMRDALAAGEVDAASVVEPFASVLAQDPALMVLDRGSLSGALPAGERVLIVGLVATRSWIAAKPDAVRHIGSSAVPFLLERLSEKQLNQTKLKCKNGMTGRDVPCSPLIFQQSQNVKRWLLWMRSVPQRWMRCQHWKN